MSLDYSPEPGSACDGIDLSHGIIRSEHAGRANTVERAIVRRLLPHRSGVIDAYDHEVLLPDYAPTSLRKLVTLVRTYEAQQLPRQRDLLSITTVRFNRGLTHHSAWELARCFARCSFNARNLAVVMVHHVPALAGRKHKAHVHLLAPVREPHQEFGPFVMLDKATLAAEWREIVAGGRG